MEYLKLSNIRKWFMKLHFLLKAYLILLAVAAVAAVVVIGYIGWVMWAWRTESTYLIKDGVEQAALKDAIICKGIPSGLDDSVTFKNIFNMAAFRSYTIWYEVTFDPEKSDAMKVALLADEYKIETEERLKQYIAYDLQYTPRKIAKWWKIDDQKKFTMHTHRGRVYRTECFLNEEQGILLIVTGY